MKTAWRHRRSCLWCAFQSTRRSAAIAQQRSFYLADLQFRVAIAQALLNHHLFGVVSPALRGRICFSYPPCERPARMGAARQILHEVARPNLMRRYDLEPGEVIGFEILFELVREPGLRWRDVVEGLRRAPLQRAGRVHSGCGRRALETRSLFDFWQEIARNGRDVMVQNEGA